MNHLHLPWFTVLDRQLLSPDIDDTIPLCSAFQCSVLVIRTTLGNLSYGCCGLLFAVV
jgi:hypothetical protein